jgi:hypothetical protein
MSKSDDYKIDYEQDTDYDDDIHLPNPMKFPSPPSWAKTPTDSPTGPQPSQLRAYTKMKKFTSKYHKFESPTKGEMLYYFLIILSCVLPALLLYFVKPSFVLNKDTKEENVLDMTKFILVSACISVLLILVLYWCKH